MSRECSQCDTVLEDDEEAYSVNMRDKDSISPDLEFYTIPACSIECVREISTSGRVSRLSYEKKTVSEI